jgi:predicted N-acetyltransferase YhbS
MELLLATAEQARARDEVTYESWGRPQLALDEYLRREERLRLTAWSRFGLRPWVLVEDGEVVASCETYAMKSRVDAVGGATQGVASVFVEARLRGQRFASQMMKLLAERLRSEGAQASILFSEVGDDLYRRAGYVLRPNATLAWPAASRATKASRVRLSGLTALFERAERRPLAYRICLSVDQVEWHLARSEFYRALWKRPEPRCVALRVGEAWTVLCPNHRFGRLTLLDFEPGTADETAAVIAAAADEAAYLELSEVTLVENPHNEGKLSPGIRRECDEGLPMILPLAQGLRAEHWTDYARGVWI